GRQESVIYRNPHYDWWATPDGVERDRVRVSKSLAVIVHNPLWFAGVMIHRMREMLQYTGFAPLVDVHFDERPQARAPETIPSMAALAPGRALTWLRTPVKRAERAAKETFQSFALLGALVTLFISRRRWLMISVVPLYYLIFQSVMV